MQRTLDLLFATIGLFLAIPLLLILALIGLWDTGSPIFMQTRVGRHQRPFILVKLRTMKPDAPHVATHLADASAVTPFGSFLRRTKLDELPQLWNVLTGDMSLVGPRPCLPSQQELIDERAQRGVYGARPGITGLAQLSGIDMSTPELLAETDRKMLEELSISSYLRYILLTVMGRGAGDRIARG